MNEQLTDVQKTVVSFTDMLGVTGRSGDRVLAAGFDRREMPVLEIATVLEVITREPNPFASGLSLRVRVGDGESRIYEPGEIVVIPRSAVRAA
ncbi:hypothetical protein [Arthrobacter bambusae]|uniref:Uncharacterized protein n=1 Tax=Arthrobacter bambusae TaxID=1338426 RepID=A0AAW8DGV1_9MICC|nr:hypothetical protein [Arthrobacter bambusae]MDP9904600.1 hypothetical protein [Arthrobacter bambusae]MDQ0129416.1 hypothetical protein [Arthrobacter bambusae]MDQ0180971.1 hypothetical protein [Arthrobacter bambusae]